MASGRSLRRRRPQTERRPAASVLLVFAFAVSVSGAQQPESEGGSALLDRFIEEVTTLEARFEQEVWSSDGRLLEVQSGTFALARPGRFLWHTQEPFEQLLIADDENLWMYDVELEQETLMPIDETTSSTPAMLLGGEQGVREGFTVIDEYVQDGLSWVALAPDLPGADFRSVALAFDDAELRRFNLVDALGQLTRIELSDVMVNTDLDADLFRFDPSRRTGLTGGTAAR